MARNEIDRFISRGTPGKGLRPSGQASPLALVRRLTFDLTGLPPALMRSTRFYLNMQRSDRAYEELVDRLLASPAMRAVRPALARRGASTPIPCGCDKDKLRPIAWPYRDSCLKSRSFNEDKPYGRFVRNKLRATLFSRPTR